MSSTDIVVTSAWTDRGEGTGDLSCLLLSAGKVRGEADFVFYNQPASSGSEVVLAPAHHGSTQQRVDLFLSRLPGEVDSLVVVMSYDGPTGATLAAIKPLSVNIRDSLDSTGHTFALNDLTSETAVVLLEFYRRNGGWKVRAVGQGYFDGLAGLARDFGVVVDDEPGPPAEPQAAVSPPPATVSPPPPPSPAFPDALPSAVLPPPLPRPPGIDWRNPPIPRGY